MKLKKNLISILLLSTLTIPLISAIPFLNKSNCGEMIVLDTDNDSKLPHNYRDIAFLNISGSAQFIPSQLPNLKQAINKENIAILDLRQESHGFVNDIAISFYSPFKTLNDGLTTEQVTKVENKELNSIKIGSTLNIYSKLGQVKKDFTVESVSTEDAAVIKNNIQYNRFAVRDGGTPTPTVVDNFVEFIKNKPVDQHLHFHCDAGDGRTTTFMIMYQTMFNEKNASLQEIQNFQTSLGTVKFKYDKNREDYLQSFYNYVSANKKDNYKTPYSEWIKQ